MPPFIMPGQMHNPQAILQRQQQQQQLTATNPSPAAAGILNRPSPGYVPPIQAPDVAQATARQAAQAGVAKPITPATGVAPNAIPGAAQASPARPLQQAMRRPVYGFGQAIQQPRLTPQ